MEDTVVCIAGRHYKLSPKAIEFVKKLHEITGIDENDPKAREKMTAILLEMHRREQAEKVHQ